MKRLGDAVELRGPDGDMLKLARDLTEELNKPANISKGDKPIDDPETVRRWVHDGCDGLASLKYGE